VRRKPEPIFRAFAMRRDCTQISSLEVAEPSDLFGTHFHSRRSSGRLASVPGWLPIAVHYPMRRHPLIFTSAVYLIVAKAVNRSQAFDASARGCVRTKKKTISPNPTCSYRTPFAVFPWHVMDCGTEDLRREH
jgi:hypothetical protein